jgi:hypothetical protein
MTLPEFVTWGRIGSRALRLEFETGILNTWYGRSQRGENWPGFDTEMNEGLWELAFRYWLKGMTNAARRQA